MKRTVSAHLEIYLYDTVELILSLAVAEGAHLASESVVAAASGTPVAVRELTGRHGTRLHVVTGDAGWINIDYNAEITGALAPPPNEELDLIEYRRPSRYCESDSLMPTATSEFAGLAGKPLLDAVASWVGEKLNYVPGLSRPTDGAVATLLAREGVCRDYAHLTTALLRSMDVPARLVSVYAPGLQPMDFHAVVEAWVEGAWHVVDATGLAPRQSLVRIATGQDAAETAFLTQRGGRLDLRNLSVSATVDSLPVDDPKQLVILG
ncbi:MAG: transglutaminase family protein [Aeromicrobium sp.]